MQDSMGKAEKPEYSVPANTFPLLLQKFMQPSFVTVLPLKVGPASVRFAVESLREG
jgi:hypothetical protein